MPNPHRAEVSITLCGRERVLRFDFNKLIELQERIGATSLDEVRVNLGKMGMADLRWLVWIGLEPDADGDKPTEEDVGRALGVELSLQRTFDRVREALELSFLGPESERETAPEAEGATGADPLPEGEAEPEAPEVTESL